MKHFQKKNVKELQLHSINSNTQNTTKNEKHFIKEVHKSLTQQISIIEEFSYSAKIFGESLNEYTHFFEKKFPLYEKSFQTFTSLQSSIETSCIHWIESIGTFQSLIKKNLEPFGQSWSNLDSHSQSIKMENIRCELIENISKYCFSFKQFLEDLNGEMSTHMPNVTANEIEVVERKKDLDTVQEIPKTRKKSKKQKMKPQTPREDHTSALLSPRLQSPLLPKRVMIRKIFGVDLKEAIEPPNLVPTFLLKAVSYLDRSGLTQLGLFRVAGDKKRVGELYQSFSEGSEVEFVNEHHHVVCSLIKRYLRELPEPVIPFGKLEDFLSTFEQPENEVLDYLKEMIEALPTENATLLEFVVSFLNRIALKSSENQMNVSNLASLIAPNLMYRREPDMSKIMSDTNISNQVLEVILKNSNYLFEKIAKQECAPTGGLYNHYGGKSNPELPSLIIATNETPRQTRALRTPRKAYPNKLSNESDNAPALPSNIPKEFGNWHKRQHIEWGTSAKSRTNQRTNNKRIEEEVNLGEEKENSKNVLNRIKEICSHVNLSEIDVEMEIDKLKEISPTQPVKVTDKMDLSQVLQLLNYNLLDLSPILKINKSLEFSSSLQFSAYLKHEISSLRTYIQQILSYLFHFLRNILEKCSNKTKSIRGLSAFFTPTILGAADKDSQVVESIINSYNFIFLESTTDSKSKREFSYNRTKTEPKNSPTKKIKSANASPRYLHRGITFKPGAVDLIDLPDIMDSPPSITSDSLTSSGLDLKPPKSPSLSSMTHSEDSLKPSSRPFFGNDLKPKSPSSSPSTRPKSKPPSPSETLKVTVENEILPSPLSSPLIPDIKSSRLSLLTSGIDTKHDSKSPLSHPPHISPLRPIPFLNLPLTTTPLPNSPPPSLVQLSEKLTNVEKEIKRNSESLNQLVMEKMSLKLEIGKLRKSQEIEQILHSLEQ